MHLYIHIYFFISMYIYIEREREIHTRETMLNQGTSSSLRCDNNVEVQPKMHQGCQLIQ